MRLGFVMLLAFVGLAAVADPARALSLGVIAPGESGEASRAWAAHHRTGAAG